MVDETKQDTKELKDQIGNSSDYEPVLNMWKTEELSIYDDRLLIERREINDQFIVGHSVNGRCGASYGYKVGTGQLGNWETVRDETTDQQVTNVCRAEIVKWLINSSADYPTHIGVGTDDTEFDVTDTELGNETGTRVSITSDNSTSKTIVYTALYSDRYDEDIVEAGIFNASSNGDMFVRRTFDSFDLDSFGSGNYHLHKFTWTIKLFDV